MFSLISLVLKSQDVKIVVNGTNFENIKIGDTIMKSSFNREYLYHRKECEKDLLIIISNKSYLIKDLSKQIKLILFDVDNDAENGCYVINEFNYDIVQSSNIENLKKCSNLTNIGLFDNFNQNSNSNIKIKAKKH